MYFDIMVLAAAGFCSGLIKTGVGVGAGIFLLPTLSLAFPAKIALGLGAPMMLVSDIIGLRLYWRQWLPRKELLRLLLAALPGLILGAVLLPLIPGGVFRFCVGVFGCIYALSLLWPGFPVAVLLKRLFSELSARHADKSACIYGFLGGAATVLAHAGGIVWSLYLVTTARDRRVFVGTTIIMFFLTNIYKLLLYISIDLIDGAALLKMLPAIPMIFLGSHIGNIINKRCDASVFRRVVLCFIFISSFSLLF